MAAVLVMNWGSNKKGKFLESTGIVDEMAISRRWWLTVAAACSLLGAAPKANFKERNTETTKKSHEDKPRPTFASAKLAEKTN